MPESPPSKPRWYRLTPDRFLAGLMGAIGLLLLSERFCWFAFNEHKGWTVLISVAVICVAVTLLLLWCGVSLVSRLRFQFSLRSMLVFVTVVAVVCSWFTVKMQQAQRQREVIAAIETEGEVYDVFFDYELDADGNPLPAKPKPPGPPWLRNLVGVDFLSDVTFLVCRRATDAELVHLKGLTSLETLWLHDTYVTDAGVQDLQKALPNCKIYH